MISWYEPCFLGMPPQELIYGAGSAGKGGVRRMRGGDDGYGYRHNRHTDITSGWVIITN